MIHHVVATLTGMTSVNWLDAREERVWRALQFMQMRLTARLARDLALESGLSYPDYLVLVVLTDQPDGRMRAFRLGHELGWEQSRVSHHVARMAKRGLVTRERCDADRRGAYVVVTAAGREAIRQAAPGHVGTVRSAFIDQLDAGELDAIGAVADKVLAALDALDDAEEEGGTDR